MRRRIKSWLGFSDKLDIGTKNTFLIMEVIVYVLSCWILVDIFILKAMDVALQGGLLLSIFLTVFILLKKKRYFLAKCWLITLSFFQLFISIYVSFGVENGVSSILYLMIPQATMIFDFKNKKEKNMIIMTFVATTVFMIVTILQLDSYNEMIIMLSTAITIIIAFSVVFYNYTRELGKAFGELNYIASRDGLTGIYNRRAFSEMGESKFAEGVEHPFALAIFDIDGFKKVNDSWGHPAGDMVLNYISCTVKNSIRTKDFFARIGGEEFAVILDDVDLRSSVAVMEKVRVLIENLRIPVNDKETISITVSVGISMFRSNYKNFDEIFLQADEALYIAKNSGKNQIKAFTAVK